MGWIKEILGKRAFAYVRSYIEDHWDEIVDQGKDYVIQLIDILEAKLFGEGLFFGDNESLSEFADGLDEVTVDNGEES